MPRRTGSYSHRLFMFNTFRQYCYILQIIVQYLCKLSIYFHNMDKEQLLHIFGITDKRADVYLAVLEQGSATVQAIARQAGVLRTTAYDLLDDLNIRGLITHRIVRGRRYYRATDPRRFQQIIDRQQREVEKGLPELLALYKPSKEQPSVRFFEGAAEIQLIYREVENARSLDAYGSFAKIERYFPHFRLHVENQLKRGLRVRDLDIRDPVSESYRPYFDSPERQLRFLPADMILDTDTMIFSNKVAFISFGETIHGLVVDSKAIADTQRKVFETLWRMAEPS